MSPDPARPEPADARGPVPELAIELRNVGKRFGSAWVIQELDIAVEAGTIFGVFGPSGAGKTTTIRLVLGLISADAGSLRVLDTDPRRFGALQRSCIGYMPQNFVLYPELTVTENLSLVASLYGLGWWKRRAPMRRVLELVQLWEHRRKQAAHLSGGMRRRLELAAALIHDPKLLVVDEPTAGIDPILRAKMWDHFRELRDQGRTLLVTSQYVTEAEYCDRVAVLGHGRLVAIGSPAAVRRQAMGGDVVDVTAERFDWSIVDELKRLDGILNVQPRSYDALRLTVSRAGEAIPRVLALLAAQGIDVKQIQEYRPSFDEVFVRLVEQADALTLA